MIEYIPYIFQLLLFLAIGLVSLLFYMGNRKSGLALIGVAFFINAVPSVVNMALGGPYLTLRLIEQGYTIAEIGMLNFQLFLVNSAFEIIFAIIAMAGLVKLSRQS